MPKRCFDFLFSFAALLVLVVPLIFIGIAAAFDTRSGGFFTQDRVGQYGKLFRIYKFRTITKLKSGKHKISKTGMFLRKHKLDELPQLWNVLIGDMSVVGPRPDILGYYDKLEGENRKILELRPGLTSLASIKYFNEEMLLAKVEDSARYNDAVLFPDKVKMNLDYYYTKSFFGDLQIIVKTVFRSWL